jgi:citrate synthase
MTKSSFLTARQAADLLEVSLPTLYAYVSRGLIHSQASGEGHQHVYQREDVEILMARKQQRRDPARAVQQALHWGAPILESGLTLISEGHFYYRGYDAVSLSRNQTFERLVALLWLGDLKAPLVILPAPAGDPVAEVYPHIFAETGDASTVEAFQIALTRLSVHDQAAYDLRQTAVVQAGTRILRQLTTVAARNHPLTASGIAQALQRSWIPQTPAAAGLINTALALSIDHELNVSTFTARCVASAGSSPYAVVIAGLSALQGVKHGGMLRRIAALFDEVRAPGNAVRVLSNRMKRGETIPGFGHPLYPEGDPRGRLLLSLTEEAFPGSTAFAQEIATATFELIAEQPTIDFGLVVLARALTLTTDQAMALFALGRVAGWIAHALEQYQSDQLIRPRARYVGPPPRT